MISKEKIDFLTKNGFPKEKKLFPEEEKNIFLMINGFPEREQIDFPRQINGIPKSNFDNL